MTTKRKPKKKPAAKPKRKVQNAHTELVVAPTEVVEAPELVFPPGSFAPRPPERTFWQRVGDFFRGLP